MVWILPPWGHSDKQNPATGWEPNLEERQQVSVDTGVWGNNAHGAGASYLWGLIGVGAKKGVSGYCPKRNSLSSGGRSQMSHLRNCSKCTHRLERSTATNSLAWEFKHRKISFYCPGSWKYKIKVWAGFY